VINALDFVPTATRGTLTITAPATSFVADAAVADNFTVTNYIPGAVYDVTATYGSGAGDADNRLVGSQVQAPLTGPWNLSIRRPYLTSTQVSTISLSEIEGRSSGQTTVTYTADNFVRHFDFDTTSNPSTEAGYTSVLGSTRYSDSLGYGWQPTASTPPGSNIVNEALRGVDGSYPITPSSTLLRDSQYSANTSTFTVSVPVPATGAPAYTYTITIYSYDRNASSAISMSVTAEGTVGTGNYGVAPNTLVARTLTINSSQISTDGKLDLTFARASGSYFFVNAIDVAVTQLAQPGQEGNAQNARTVAAAELQSVADAAIQRFQAAGATLNQLSLLHNVQFQIQNLGGPGYLGLTTSRSQVLIDDNGAGYGWYIDAMPLDNREFKKADGRLRATGKAKQHMDLLSVVMHEFSNVLKLNGESVPTAMSDVERIRLELGQRWDSPTPDVLDVAFQSHHLKHDLLKMGGAKQG
jgi:hypothetical protein